MNKAKPKALGRRKSLQPMTFRVDFEVSVSQHEGDPSDFITVYQGDIIGMMDDDDEWKMGTLVLYMVERGRAMNEGVSLFEVMDCLDGDSCDCFANLFDSETEQLKPGVEHLISENRATQWDIMLIERLELNPECRGRGLGIEIAQRAILKLGENCGVITCVPAPLQFTGLGPNDQKPKGLRLLNNRFEGSGSALDSSAYHALITTSGQTDIDKLESILNLLPPDSATPDRIGR